MATVVAAPVVDKWSVVHWRRKEFQLRRKREEEVAHSIKTLVFINTPKNFYEKNKK